MELKDILPFLDPEVLKRWTEYQQTRDWNLVDWTQPKTFTDLANVVRNSGLGGDVREALAKMFEEVSVMVGAGANKEQARQILDLIGNSIKRGQVTMADLTQEVREILNGDRPLPIVGKDSVIGYENIVDETVTERKTTFFKNNPKNLFNGTYMKGFILNQQPDTGREWFEERPDLSGCVCVIIEVQPNTTYYLKKHENSDRFRIGTFASYPTSGMDTLRQDRNGNTLNNKVFTTLADENYIVVQLSNSSQTPTFTVSIDEEVTLFVLNLNEYVQENSFDGETIKDGTIPIKKLPFVEQNPNNRFDGVYREGWLLAKNIEGQLYEYRNDSVQPLAVSIIVPIEEGRTQFIKKFDVSDRFRVATFDHEPTHLSTPIRGFEPTGATFEFEPSSNEKYLVVQVSITGQKPRIAVNSIGFTDHYESSRIISSSYLPNQNQSILKKGKYILSGKFNEYYQTEELADMSSGKQLVLETTTSNDIYNLYDNLIADSHMTKNLLGYAKNSTGLIDTNLPIYEYSIITPQTNQKTHTGGFDTTLADSPLVLITSGVHGNEKASVWGVYQFVRQLLTNPTNNEMLDDLKSNVSFKIIPLVNPGGYNANTRNNLQDYNINRDFAYNNSNPYTQVETQIVRDWLAKYNYALAYIDYHNFTRINFPGRNVESVSYHFSPNSQLDIMYGSVMRRLSNKWRDKYFSNFANLGNIAFGFNHSGYYLNTSTTINEAYHVHGIKLSATPETTYNDPVTPTTLYTKTVVETSTEMFINYLLTLIDNFKD